MRISKRLDGTIEVVTDGKGLAKFLLGACLLLSGLAAYHFFAGPGHGEQFIGSIAAAALWFRQDAGPGAESAAAIWRERPLTAFPGEEAWPAQSPDGGTP